MNFKQMTSQAVQGTWICTVWFRGEWVMVKKIIIIKCKKGDFIGRHNNISGQPVFFIVAHKVKNPNWPKANHLNGYIHKKGYSQDFSKGTFNFPHPPPPTSKSQIVSRYHTYHLRFTQPINLVTSLETDIRVWKKHSVVL